MALAARRRRPGNRAAMGAGGFTLLEVMVALAIIGLVVYAIATTLNKTGKLRTGAVDVASLLRVSYNLATSTGTHHRVMFDIENGVFRIEACPDDIKLERTEEEHVVDAEKLAEMLERKQQNTTDLPEILAASSPEEAAQAAAALAGMRIGTVRCEPPKLPTGASDPRGTSRKLPDGIKIKKIHVQHLEDPVKEGIASVNFFPLGTAEKAVIELIDTEDDDKSWWVILHRITGRVEFATVDRYDPDDHMRRNAIGDAVADDR